MGAFKALPRCPIISAVGYESDDNTTYGRSMKNNIYSRSKINAIQVLGVVLNKIGRLA